MGSWPQARSPATIGPLPRGFDDSLHGSVQAVWDVVHHTRLPPWTSWTASWARTAIRYLAQHSGIPALLVAAVLLVVGWRLVRKTFRFAVEVALVTAALLAATQLGWIRW